MAIVSPKQEVLLSLEPRSEVAGTARRALQRAGLHEDVAHAVELLVTELIANALEHAITDREHQRLVLFARIGDDFARVELADPGPGFDPAKVQTGLGLRLLAALASRWGTERRERGFRVWFEVDRRPVAERTRRFAR